MSLALVGRVWVNPACQSAVELLLTMALSSFMWTPWRAITIVVLHESRADL